jgi:hypothetical protein
MKIIDCFSFHNEVDLLKLRLQTLNAVVDHFLVVEAGQTHSGLPKELTLSHMHNTGQLNLEKSILNKLEVHALEKFPLELDAWGRERFQRDIALSLIEERFANQSSLYLLVCDLDELPHPGFIHQLRALQGFERHIAITMWLCYFRPNYVRIRGNDREWSGPFLSPIGLAKEKRSLSEIRELVRQKSFFQNESIGRYQGWHLSYQGNDDFIYQKRKAFAHQEDGVQSKSISVERLIESRRGPYDDQEAAPQWAILPEEVLGMPDRVTRDPFIRDRIIKVTDNVGQVLLAHQPKLQSKQWSLRALWGAG